MFKFIYNHLSFFVGLLFAVLSICIDDLTHALLCLILATLWYMAHTLETLTTEHEYVFIPKGVEE